MSKVKQTILSFRLLLVLLLCVSGLTACAGEYVTEEDILEMGYTVEVVYDYQGGNVSDAATTKMLFKPDSYLPEPGKANSGLDSVVRSGYSFRHFCVAQKDENGELLRDADGNLVPGRVWNFSADKATENMTLCAVWWQNFRMVLHYGDGDYSQTKEVSVPRTTDGNATEIAAASTTIRAYTVLGYFLRQDQNAESAVAFPATLAFADENPTVDVWCKSLEGSFQIIRSASDLAGFSFLRTTNIYLDADIDMNDIYNAGKSFDFPTTYAGKFYGNKHTIANLKIELTPSGPTDVNFGIFKTLESGAEVTDLLLRDVDFTANLTNAYAKEYTVGLLAGVARSGCKVKNVTATGSLRYTVADGFDKEKITVKQDIGLVNNADSVQGCDFSAIDVAER